MSLRNYPNSTFPTLEANRVISSSLTPTKIPSLRAQTLIPPSLSPAATTLNEMADISRANNDANYHADQLIYRIHEYGDSSSLWPMIANLNLDMQDLVLFKVMLHFAYRAEIIKLLVAASLYINFGTNEQLKRNKHLRLVLKILKELGRSDMIEEIKLKYGDIDY